jgi:dihydrofolate reductase
MTTKLNLVVATDINNTIGSSRNNSIPWHLPPDLKYFRELTLRKPIIMGKNTFLSLKEPLPGRMNIVVTRNPKDVFPFVNGELAFGYNQVPIITCLDLNRAIELASSLAEEVMIVGGGQIYKEALEKHDISTIYKTTVMIDSGGDVKFPKLVINEPVLPETDVSLGVWNEYWKSPMQEYKGLKFYVSQLKKI